MVLNDGRVRCPSRCPSLLVLVVLQLSFYTPSCATKFTALFFNSSALDLPDYNDRLPWARGAAACKKASTGVGFAEDFGRP